MPAFSFESRDNYGYERVNIRYAQPGDYRRERYASDSTSDSGYRTRVAVPEPPSYTGPAPRDYPSSYGGSSTHSHGAYRTREAVPSYLASSHSYDSYPQPYKTRTAVPESSYASSHFCDANPQPYKTRTAIPESSYASSRASSDVPRSTYSTRTAAPDSSYSSYSSSYSSSHAPKSKYSTRTAAPESSYSSYSSANAHSSPPPARGTRPSMNLYKVLGVSRTATYDEMKKAHRKLSLMYHPDRVAPANREEATKTMADINTAWDVLGDEKARKLYDEQGVVIGANL